MTFTLARYCSRSPQGRLSVLTTAWTCSDYRRMKRWLRLASGLALGPALAFVPSISVSATGAAAQETCQLETVGSAGAAAVIDGRTFTLDDGRTVRVAGIEVPDAYGVQAKAALAALVAGRAITLKRIGGGAGEDRYGRLIAFVFVPDNGDQSVNSAMLAAGHGRANPTSATKGCVEALFAAESRARAGRLGLWADPIFAPLQVDDPARISAGQGRFTLVEGKVLSVREAGATIYVNFGRRWSRDFTVTILKRNRRMFTAAGVEPKALNGHRVRVRGVVERRGGPIIEAGQPEQIEIIDDHVRATP